MQVDFLAGECHFLDHLYPIWEALPEAVRGSIVLTRSGPASAPVPTLGEYAREHGMERACHGLDNRVEVQQFLRSHNGPVVTAAIIDLAVASASGRPQVFCEHGAGQTYSNHHKSYAGGYGHRERVQLFLCPGEGAAQQNREVYPGIPTLAIGCPKLDVWHRQPPKVREDPPVVALSFHWDCRIAPEARSAFPHYRTALRGLSREFRLLGHGHPRIQQRLRPVYCACGIEFVADFREVVRRADCYVCDTSSTLYQFASLDRPVVVLNAPWYRREVEHGLRFWEAANVGVQCDEPEALPAAIRRALRDRPQQREARQAAVRQAYAYCDGQAAARAAEAILQVDPGPEVVRPRRRSMRVRD